METVHVVVDHPIAASADIVWAYIGAFGDARVGAGFVDRVEAAESGIGACRTLIFGAAFGGGQVIERQVARDDPGRYYAYELADPGPLPVFDYRGSAHVVATAEDRCRVTWTNRYRVDSMIADSMRAQSLAILEIIDTNLKRLVRDCAEPLPSPSEQDSVS